MRVHQTLRVWLMSSVAPRHFPFTHVHVVVWPFAGQTLSAILHSWKSFTASSANKLLCRAGQAFWQTESFDHWIRDGAEHARLTAYVHNNPVKAGFCRAPEELRWSSAHERCSGGLPSLPWSRCFQPAESHPQFKRTRIIVRRLSFRGDGPGGRMPPSTSGTDA